MMLRALLPGIAVRYAFAGLALSTIFPIFGLLSEYVLADRSQQVQLRLDDPFHLIVLASPLFASLAGYWFGTVKAELIERLKLRQKSERLLLHLSLHDRLTGLPNRMALERDILAVLGARDANGAQPGVMLLDLDKFKHVNDTLGHDAGDELLVQFSQRVVGSLGAAARLFRLGGDEFAVVVPFSPSRSQVEALCEAIKTNTGKPFQLRSGRAVVGVSIGAAFLQPTDAGMADVMKRADLALYAAKDVPGSAHVFHTAALEAGMLERMRGEQEIASGLARDEFFLEYQPIVSAGTGRIGGFEALVRWNHPERGVLAPDAFLPLAERSGHIMALGKFVMARAIEDASRWPRPIGVAVNVTGDEFRDPHFVQHVKTSLEIHGFPPGRLTVEITESIFTVDVALVSQGLAELRAMGVKVALDDFGAGFSSISHLKRFPVDHLKIDRSFARDMMAGDRATELVDIILRLGRIFNVSTTIEGIETEAQLELVRALGACDVQGYHISRPLPAGLAGAMLDFLPEHAAPADLRLTA